MPFYTTLQGTKALTGSLSENEKGFTKDKVTCLIAHLFVFEKAFYTYNNAACPHWRQNTHLTVICSIPLSLQVEYKK